MMKKKTYQIIFPLLLLIAMISSCSSDQSENRLQEGDLLFQDLNCGGLCDAIEAVTEGVDGKDFSHCAMVVRVGDSLKIIEAIGSKVRLTKVEDFLKRSNDVDHLQNITIARVSQDHQSLIHGASAYALSKVGEPYDHEFLLDNGSWYCSELLYESFKHANGGEDFFQLYPMTYKMPSQDEFFPVWVKYYEDLQKPIPEGEPGLNPGSISRSDKLEIIKLRAI